MLSREQNYIRQIAILADLSMKPSRPLFVVLFHDAYFHPGLSWELIEIAREPKLVLEVRAGWGAQ